MTDQLALPGVAADADATHLTIDGAVDYDTWLAAGTKLLGAASSVSWWVGDWLIHGQRQWGDTDSGAAMLRREVVALTNLDPQTLQRLEAVAAAVAPERRRAALSYTHHADVAALAPEHQERLLAAAEEGDVDPISGERRRWSTERLRQEVRALRAELAGDPLPGLPAPSRPLRVMVPRPVVASVLPTLRRVVEALDGEDRDAMATLVALLEKDR